ncbi:MAG: hypothetical protein WC365_08945 [Candidatus Babeliales bacterium]|jgi:hypothetical protein
MKKLLILVVILVLLPIRFGWGQEGHRSKMGKLAHEVAMEVDSILEGKPITVYALDAPRPIGYWVEWKREWFFPDTLYGGYIRDVSDTHWVYPVIYEPILDSIQVKDPEHKHVEYGDTCIFWVPDSTWKIDTVGWVRK